MYMRVSTLEEINIPQLSRSVLILCLIMYLLFRQYCHNHFCFILYSFKRKKNFTKLDDGQLHLQGELTRIWILRQRWNLGSRQQGSLWQLFKIFHSDICEMPAKDFSGLKHECCLPLRPATRVIKSVCRLYPSSWWQLKHSSLTSCPLDLHLLFSSSDRHQLDFRNPTRV